MEKTVLRGEGKKMKPELVRSIGLLLVLYYIYIYILTRLVCKCVCVQDMLQKALATVQEKKDVRFGTWTNAEVSINIIP